MKYYLGIDIGSSATKGLLLDEASGVVARAILPSGLDFKQSGQKIRFELLSTAGIDDNEIAATCATGYGRSRVEATLTKTEIACHSLAAFQIFQKEATLVDIGGQDAKVIHLGADGKVLDFKMNRSCAAGTGSFLEELSRRAQLDLAALPLLARKSTKELHLNSYCTVFAISELIGLAREGAELPDLVKAAYQSVVNRVRELSTLKAPLIFSGGVVAYHPMIAQLLAETASPTILPDSQFCGALGAALFARKSAEVING